MSESDVDGELRSRLAESTLRSGPSSEPAEADDHLDLVRRVVAAEDEVRGLSQQAVNAGRAAGDSWEAIGSCPGMSRQAAQQRFGRERRTDSDDGGDRIRWIGPVTALDQMAELEIAGHLG